MSSARNAAAMTAPRLLEESIALLRQAPGALIPYYIGAVPFWLGFLYFFSDMSQSAYATERLVGSALVMGAVAAFGSADFTLLVVLIAVLGALRGVGDKSKRVLLPPAVRAKYMR